jgi:hypothetical protein
VRTHVPTTGRIGGPGLPCLFVFLWLLQLVAHLLFHTLDTEISRFNSSPSEGKIAVRPASFFSACCLVRCPSIFPASDRYRTCPIFLFFLTSLFDSLLQPAFNCTQKPLQVGYCTGHPHSGYIFPTFPQSLPRSWAYPQRAAQKPYIPIIQKIPHSSHQPMFCSPSSDPLFHSPKICITCRRR